MSASSSAWRRNLYRRGGHPRWPYVLVKPVSFRWPIYGLELSVPGFVSLSRLGLLTLYPGYAWNLSSPLQLERAILPAAPHDAGYQLHNLGLLPFHYRDTIDRAFQRELIAAGLNRPTAAVHYQAVKRFGVWAAWPDRLHSAP